MEKTALQREIRLREALRTAVNAWADVCSTANAIAIYNEAAAAIAESELATQMPCFPEVEITHAILQQIMPRLPADKRSLYLPHLNAAMQKFEINTPLRAAAFLAQISHESGELKYFEEIWGANGGTAAQKRYEPPSSLAARLGNTEKGDGYRYRGRGPIQLTGRANYNKYGSALGVNLVNNPDLAADPVYAFQTAALYWKSHNCNELADKQDFIAITRAINGGTNGLAERERYYETAKAALGAA